MIPKQFIEECEARGGRPWEEWHALGDTALERLVAVARSCEDQTVSFPDSQAIAEDLVGDYGEGVVAKLAHQTLTYGLGKQVLDMRFFAEDGSEIPQDTAFAEMRRHMESDPEGTWEFGASTYVKWVLLDHAGEEGS